MTEFCFKPVRDRNHDRGRCDRKQKDPGQCPDIQSQLAHQQKYHFQQDVDGKNDHPLMQKGNSCFVWCQTTVLLIESFDFLSDGVYHAVFFQNETSYPYKRNTFIILLPHGIIKVANISCVVSYMSFIQQWKKRTECVCFRSIVL